MEIDWALLILLTVAVLFVGGLVLALQTATGRKRMGEAALALAERLIAYAIDWLERNQGGVDVPTAAASDGGQRISDARAALMILRGQ